MSIFDLITDPSGLSSSNDGMADLKMELVACSRDNTGAAFPMVFSISIFLLVLVGGYLHATGLHTEYLKAIANITGTRAIFCVTDTSKTSILLLFLAE